MTFVYTETRPLTAGNTLIFLRTLMNDYIFFKVYRVYDFVETHCYNAQGEN